MTQLVDDLPNLIRSSCLQQVSTRSQPQKRCGWSVLNGPLHGDLHAGPSHANVETNRIQRPDVAHQLEQECETLMLVGN